MDQCLLALFLTEFLGYFSEDSVFLMWFFIWKLFVYNIWFSLVAWMITENFKKIIFMCEEVYHLITWNHVKGVYKCVS